MSTRLLSQTCSQGDRTFSRGMRGFVGCCGTTTAGLQAEPCRDSWEAHRPSVHCARLWCLDDPPHAASFWEHLLAPPTLTIHSWKSTRAVHHWFQNALVRSCPFKIAPRGAERVAEKGAVSCQLAALLGLVEPNISPTIIPSNEGKRTNESGTRRR